MDNLDPNVDPELALDLIFGPAMYRMVDLLALEPQQDTRFGGTPFGLP
jgi:hypothetical protein